MRNLFLLTACLCTAVLFAQEIDNTNPTSGQSLLSVLEEIENRDGVRFFFRPEWVEGKSTEIQIGNSPINTLLRTLFENSELSFYQDGNDIYLTQNTQIISHPALEKVLEVEETQVQEIEKGLVFSREYLGSTTDEEKDVVNEVGLRNLYVDGSQATVAGYIREKVSGEPVEGVFIYIDDPFTGTSSAADGFYSLRIPTGRQTLLIQSVNMKDTYRTVILLSDGKLDINLDVDVVALNAVVIDADRDINTRSTQMGITRIDVEQVKEVPVLLGEQDLIKVAATTSGVQTVGEGSAGVNIRGGKADQNLFILDGAPIYNTAHFFGFFSVINSDVVEGMELYKNGIPAQYGGRLSSVFDIKSKDLDEDKISGKGGVGPVTSRLQLDGPIFKNGPKFMLGARGTYSDFVLGKIENSPIGNNRVTFRDIIGKIQHETEKDKISLTGYYSFDSFRLSSDTLLSFTNFSYSNTLAAFNWTHEFGSKLKSHINISSTDYDYNIGYDQLSSQAFEIDFRAREKTYSGYVDYQLNESINLKSGLEIKSHQIDPGQKSPFGSESLIAADFVDSEQGTEYAPFISMNLDKGGDWSIDAGLRFSLFQVKGPGTVYQYDGNKVVLNRTDTVSYGKGETIASYSGLEPRIAGRYKLNDFSSIKASYNRTRQNIHLLLNAASIAPTDIWRLSSAHIPPQIADQFSLGYYQNFYGKHTIETSAEVYYKDIQNLLDFKVGADLLFNKAIETEILQGPGRSYGLELSVNKSSGWLTGWINYTYSRSLIQLDGDTPNERINNGKFFPTGYDKPHYINSITNYKFTRRYSMSLNVVYATGVPVTYPVGKWTFRNVENLYYSDRNQFRIPDYFRLDVGLNVEGNHKIEKLGHSFWTFSVYNLLGRDNIYSIFFTVDRGLVEGYKLTVFPNPIPTVTYNFSF